jgi:hypothetical protein
LIFVAQRAERERWTQRVHFVLVYLAGTLLGTVLAHVALDGGSTSAERLTTSGNGGRLTVWKYSFDGLTERPIGGWGFGRFRAATQRHFSADFVRQFASDDVRQAWFDGHNLVVTTAVAVGVVGLVLAIWFGVASSVLARGPLAYFVLVLALTWLVQPAGLSTLPVGLLALGTSVPRLEAETVAATTRRPRMQLAFTMVGTLVAAWILVADVALKRAVDAQSADGIESAATLFPRDSVVADLAAQAWLLEFVESGRDDSIRPKVLRWSERSVDWEPDRPYFLASHAGRLLAFGDYSGARAALDRALVLQPWHIQSWLGLHAIAVRTDDADLRRQSLLNLCELGVPLDDCATLTTPPNSSGA